MYAAIWTCQAELLRIISLLHQTQPEDRMEARLDPNHPNKDDLASQVRRVLSQHMAERITLNDLAKELHISSSSLSHRYRELAGESPMQTLAALRIARAKSLLLQGQQLGAIAPQTGFCDAFHLSKTFKRLTGTSPRVFVNQRE